MDKVIKEMKEWFDKDSDSYYEKNYRFGVSIGGEIYEVTLYKSDIVNFGDYTMDEETRFLYAMVSRNSWLLKPMIKGIDEFIPLNDGRLWE